MTEKRLFFGWEVQAPWPETLPFGRHLDEAHRHLTLAFLGKTNYSELAQALSAFPTPPFSIGYMGYFDQCLFLPEKHPHVVAWHIEWFNNGAQLQTFYEMVVQWLHDKGFPVDIRHGFMPHVTLARSPFHSRAWRKQFSPLPLMIKDLHLYESIGNLKYTPLWSLRLLSPFEEREHMADIAFLIRGLSFDQLYRNGACALAFHFPPFLSYIHNPPKMSSLEEVVMELNQIVTRADQEIGCPFKAVSYHSTLETIDGCMNWEMIIDV